MGTHDQSYGFGRHLTRFPHGLVWGLRQGAIAQRRPALRWNWQGFSGGFVSSNKQGTDEVPVVSRVPEGRDYNWRLHNHVYCRKSCSLKKTVSFAICTRSRAVLANFWLSHAIFRYADCCALNKKEWKTWLEMFALYNCRVSSMLSPFKAMVCGLGRVKKQEWFSNH